VQPEYLLQDDARTAPVASGTHGAEQRWFALGVAPRHEKKVSSLLQEKGYETFLPLVSRRHQYARRTRVFDLPLFPGYLFCRTDLAVRLPILTTPGVLQFTGAGRLPIPIDDDEIAALQRAASTGIPLHPCSFFQAGQRGRIVNGPLRGLEGIVANADNPVRLILSVNLLRRSVFLEIDSEYVTVG
jgi:transcription antitermination factor NusG